MSKSHPISVKMLSNINRVRHQAPIPITSSTNSSTFSVSSLSTTTVNTELDLSAIIARKQRDRTQLLDVYNAQYKRCIEQIKQNDARHLIDLIFTVPGYLPDCPLYTPADCIEFIETKLQAQYLDTTRICDSTLFITWKYTELHLSENKRK
jgi:hypothetical protein